MNALLSRLHDWREIDELDPRFQAFMNRHTWHLAGVSLLICIAVWIWL